MDEGGVDEGDAGSRQPMTLLIGLQNGVAVMMLPARPVTPRCFRVRAHECDII